MTRTCFLNVTFPSVFQVNKLFFFKSPHITVTKALSSRSHLQRIFVVFIRVCSYIFLLDVRVKKDTEKEQVTEDMLKDITEVFISETDTFSLLDMPSTFVCVDADEAEATMWVKCFPYLTG